METKINEKSPIKWWINRQPKAIAKTGIGYVAIANYKEEDDAIPCVEFSEYESKVNKLEAENARLREALERIDNECSRDDTLAWKIANDALEALNDLRKGGE